MIVAYLLRIRARFDRQSKKRPSDVLPEERKSAILGRSPNPILSYAIFGDFAPEFLPEREKAGVRR